jgi:hypothetical protein
MGDRKSRCHALNNTGKIALGLFNAVHENGAPPGARWPLCLTSSPGSLKSVGDGAWTPRSCLHLAETRNLPAEENSVHALNKSLDVGVRLMNT